MCHFHLYLVSYQVVENFRYMIFYLPCTSQMTLIVQKRNLVFNLFCVCFLSTALHQFKVVHQDISSCAGDQIGLARNL